MPHTAAAATSAASHAYAQDSFEGGDHRAAQTLWFPISPTKPSGNKKFAIDLLAQRNLREQMDTIAGPMPHARDASSRQAGRRFHRIAVD